MERSVDLIVVGAGAAGLSAALSAAENGHKVLVLEKEAEAGGSTVLSGGSICLAGTDIQKSLGIEDSEQSLTDDIRRVGKQRNDPEIVKAYVDNQAETYRWMVANGVKFANTIGYADGSPVQRKHTINPAEAVPILLEKALATGLVEIIYGARAWSLVRDSSNHRVIGVEVDSLDQFTATATYGVVLTSGGFVKAPDLLRRFSPNYADVRTRGGAGNTGDGLLMAWKLGADIIDTAYIQGNFGQHPENPGAAVLPVFKGGIAVNKRGNRYVDESITYKRLADACLQQEGNVVYQIFDQSIMEKEDPGTPRFSFKSRVGIGDILKADTLSELADMIGVPPANLEHTVERYNAFVEAGEDLDFGRNALESDQGDLVKIESGPFYAYPSSAFLLGTYCGVRVDAQMRVLDVFGMEIDGLYAAGEIVGGFHGAGEIPGTALGKAFIFGRLAAKSALMHHQSNFVPMSAI